MPLREASATKLDEIFPERDGARSQILNILDRRNGVGKPDFKLAPRGHEHLTAPGLCDPSIPDDVLRQVICRASHLAQNRTAYV